MDMPAVLAEYFPNVSIESVNEAMEDYQPVWEVLKHTWSNETLREIMQGKVSVPDSVINDAIAEKLQAMQQVQAEAPAASAADEADNVVKVELKEMAEPPVTELRITSKENGRLEIFANTKKMGRLEFSGTIEEFVHNTQASYVTYRVKERALKDHGLASWFFSRISLSMAQNLFGKIDFGEALPTTIKGNYITVDCKNILEQSELAQAKIKEHRVLDMLEIKNAVPHDGFIMFETELNIPEDVQRAALDLLLRRDFYAK